MTARGWLLAGLALAIPTAATAQARHCAAIRAITNADSRDFARFRIVAGQALSIDGIADDALGFPAPENCSTGTAPDMIDITCWWRNGGFEENSALFRQLLAHAGTCLAATLTPPAGPQPHGDARALLESRTRLQFADGATSFRVSLVESAAQAGSEPYHYVILSAEHEFGATSDEE